MLRSFLDAFHFFIEAQRDAAVAQVVAKRFDHFLVGKFEQTWTLFDERDAHSQRGEHAGVLDADHAAAHDDHGFGDFRHAKDLVAVDDGLVVEGHERRDRGLGASGQDDVLRLEFRLAASAGDLDAVGIEETCDSGNDVNAVARELRANHVDFRFDDVKRAEGKIRHGDGFLHAVVHAVNALVLVAGEMQYGFADGFAGDSAGIDGRPAHDFEPFDQRDALAEFGGLDGGALPSGAGTHDDEIVLVHFLVLPREYTKGKMPEVRGGESDGRGDSSNGDTVFEPEQSVKSVSAKPHTTVAK